ncbi:MAG: GspH/FimT family pseudopilin [Vulcanococcus sp.]|jgi:prepilin-type N-terminal cleavage/methylation domain-containing protein|uniref:GspH/FimT family pseudopilin n=1 Tax=Vulcanococcus sp. TaxID=2856995 RepID=UPI0025E56ED1|nr:GspH/FimT family pseudopilin [Vulcanococcus sp.]MBW0174267.1 GspH/FimT family pseudopilin [Vulcanococcus sp.]MBW0181916.1 GspH/FimT family pseudopilin [Vulcanococcus sp.]
MVPVNTQEAKGFSLAELLVGIAIVGLLAVLGWSGGSETLARQRLEAATRRLDQGIQRGRAEAQKLGRPCGLSLRPEGWAPPAASSLPPCLQTLETLKEPIAAGEVKLVHNFPAVLRFSSNGLVLDGGTAVLSASGTSLQRCLVMALPLGITRLGRYRGGTCEPDPSL